MLIRKNVFLVSSKRRYINCFIFVKGNQNLLLTSVNKKIPHKRWCTIACHMKTNLKLYCTYSRQRTIVHHHASKHTYKPRVNAHTSSAFSCAILAPTKRVINTHAIMHFGRAEFFRRKLNFNQQGRRTSIFLCPKKNIHSKDPPSY